MGRYFNYSVLHRNRCTLHIKLWLVSIASLSSAWSSSGDIVRDSDNFPKVIAQDNLALNDPYSTSSESQLLSAYVGGQKASYGFSITYPLACAMPKLSIAALYVRLFPKEACDSTKYLTVSRFLARWMIIFFIANAIAFLVPSAAACDPPSAFWSYPPRLDRCIDTTMLGTWISLPQIVSDVVMLAIPLPLIWKMNATPTKKLSLTLIFLAGSL